MMRKAAAYGTAMVVLATVANLLHAVSHVGQDVMSLEAWQWAYVIGVIFLSPVVAAALLWTPLRLAGAWLLLASMSGSFVFDLAYHFLIPGPDNVFTLQPGVWLVAFCCQRARMPGGGLGRLPALALPHLDTVYRQVRFTNGGPMIRTESHQATGPQT
jgi:hypothetical protein